MLKQQVSAGLISLLRLFFFAGDSFSQMKKNDKAQCCFLRGLRVHRTSMYGEGSKFLQLKLRTLMLLQM